MSTKSGELHHLRIAGLLALVWLSGCAQILGVDQYHAGPKHGTDAGADARATARIEVATPHCGACLERVCESELRACENDPACQKSASCYFACSGADKGACGYDCVSKSWPTSKGQRALEGCLLTKCNGDCASCSSAFEGQGPDCASCVERDDAPGGICDLTNGCWADPGCSGFLACLATECDNLGEATPGCRLVCGTRFPDAARQFFIDIGTRYFSGCAGPCEGGSHWRCAGQPLAWPPLPPNVKEAHVTLRFGLPSGISARACIGDDYKCLHPRTPGLSDAGTDVAFVLPTATAPQVFFDISGPFGSALFAPQQPIVGDLVIFAPRSLANDTTPIPPAGLESAATERGEVLDLAGHGVVVVYVADCVGGVADFQSKAPRVTIRTSTGSAAYYNADPAQTGGGVAWFVNVPGDSTSVDFLLDGNRERTARVPVRAGATTIVSFNYPEWL